MDWGKVIFIFFSLGSLTSTAGFLWDPNIVVLFIALALNLISTTLKIGVKKQLSSELLASSLVADFHLIPAFIFLQVLDNLNIAYVLIIGALIANIFSLALLLIESAKTNDSDY
ncbi:hypothetical protein BKH41_05265 [Helicobacter sp. 12S02232-10]|uniref:DUF6394 family protein n=1 Tax=Helicobacter sp. 12S02232-10 TaxID=1476197 RepID=UPI000BA77255|nr:DUF6394 family protein [Helicobacter sp. 12S02232-10]PAF48680.1 hypothetical protein BKH41_05265 [Helicobacter sp. 12S02232-10]